MKLMPVNPHQPQKEISVQLRTPGPCSAEPRGKGNGGKSTLLHSASVPLAQSCGVPYNETVAGKSTSASPGPSQPESAVHPPLPEMKEGILPIVDVFVGEQKCRLFLGSGSTVNIVSATTYLDFLQGKFKDIQGPTDLIQGLSKEKVETLGQVNITLSLLGRQFTERFVVMKASYFPADLLLSFQSMVSRGFVLDFSRRKLLLAEQLLHFEEHPTATSVTFHLSSPDSPISKVCLSVYETRKVEGDALWGTGCSSAVAKPNSKEVFEQACTPNPQDVSIPIQAKYLPPTLQEPREFVVDSRSSSHTYKSREPIPLNKERIMTEGNNLSEETCLLLHTFRNYELPSVVAREDDYAFYHEGVKRTGMNYFYDLADDEEVTCVSLNEDSSLQFRVR